MIVIESEGMAFHGFSWIVLLVHLFIRTSWMDCDWMWDDVSQAGWESRNSEYPWGLEELESAFQLERFKATSSEALPSVCFCSLGCEIIEMVWVMLKPPKNDNRCYCPVCLVMAMCRWLVFFCVSLLHWDAQSSFLDSESQPALTRGVQEGLAYCTCKLFSWLLMWFIVLVLILYRMPSAWRDKPMRSKT